MQCKEDRDDPSFFFLVIYEEMKSAIFVREVKIFLFGVFQSFYVDRL